MERHHFLSRALVLLMVTFMPFLGFAQQKATVTGTVISVSDSQPLPGVYVKIKGTTDGTLTDIDGKFSVDVEPTATLVFSFIGYIDQEVAVNNQTSISVSLVEDTKNLEEVVVVGYGSVKKSHAIGAISSVKNEGLDEIPVSSVGEALIGKVSGVTIQMSDASAGAEPVIRVRGTGSITADASPLVVLDGIVVDGMSGIDMNNVASIEILKDAASTAIYGSRGGNGVIMITSKSGFNGKTVFSVNSYVGLKSTPDYNSMPSISEWMNYVKENNGGELTDRMKYIQALGTETNWEDVMFDGGMTYNTSISARGGNKSTKFALGAAYLEDEGVLLTDNYKKINLNLKVNTKVNKSVSFGVTAKASYTDKDDFPIGIHDALRQSPWLPLYLDENTIQYVDRNAYPDVQVGDYAKERQFDNYINSDLFGHTGDVDISTTSNVSPYAKVLERDQNVYDFKLFTNAYLKLKLAKGLTFRTNVSAKFRSKTDEEWVGSMAHRNGTTAMQSDYDVDRTISLVNENYFSYKKEFGEHSIDAVAGFSFETWNYYNSDATGTGYEFDYIHTLNAASLIEQSVTSIEEEALQSIFGRVNYSYKNKYLASLSLRYDGSSRFGADTKYGFFPALSFGWRITEEPFMAAIPVISNLKARFSYGVTGSKDGIDRYQYMSLLEPTSAVFNGSVTTGFNAANISNPNLGWEQSLEINPGLTLGLFDNRLNFTLDFYQRTSLNLLLDQPIPSVTGFTETTVNIGQVKNTGFELEVSSPVVTGDDFRWTVTANMSKNKNELTDFAGASGLILSVDSKRPMGYTATEGYPISSFYGYVVDKEIPLKYIKDPFYPIGGKAEDIYVKDLNGDGKIDTDDRAILGSPFPTFVWSFGNNINYKQFDLSFTIQGSHGAKTVNMDAIYMENQFSSNQDYITDVTDPNFFPDADKVVKKYLTSDIVENASYVALRSVNLGYSFSKPMLQKIGFSKARVYVAGQNLLFFTADDYSSFNPEGVTYNDNPLMGGYQRGAAPVYRTVTLGVNFDF